MKTIKINRKPRNRIAIFYKRNGEYVGPYQNRSMSKRELNTLRKDGTLSQISNYILKSPLQLRKRVA